MSETEQDSIWSTKPQFIFADHINLTIVKEKVKELSSINTELHVLLNINIERLQWLNKDERNTVHKLLDKMRSFNTKMREMQNKLNPVDYKAERVKRQQEIKKVEVSKHGIFERHNTGSGFSEWRRISESGSIIDKRTGKKWENRHEIRD